MSMMYQAYQNHMDLTAPWRTGAASALRYLNLVPQGVSDKLFGRLAAALELVSRTSLILMTYSRSHGSAASHAATCRCQEHGALLDAMRLGDPREASRLMREHLVQLESQLRFTPPATETPDLVSLFGQTGRASPAPEFVA